MKTKTPVNEWSTTDLYFLINQLWYNRIVTTKGK